MYYTFGLNQNVKNIYRICHPFISGGNIESLNDLREPYLNFLQQQQPECPVNFTDSIFILDEEIEENLKKAYTAGSLDDLNQSNLIGDSYIKDEKILRMKKVAKALNLLNEIDDTLYQLFLNVIHTIFIRNYNTSIGSKGTHGGSSSGAIGVVWLTINNQINEYDILELLIHELTHHLIFIDELNTPQFYYKKIAKKENFAHSAILNLNRPLDKVVHSIVVATELITFRNTLDSQIEYKLNVHPATKKMLDDTIISCKSVLTLKNIDDVLHPRGKELVDICSEKINLL